MQPTHGEQWALPLVYSERLTIPYKTPIVASTDPAKPTLSWTTASAWRVGVTKRPDGTEWVWWTASGGHLRAAALVNGRLPILVRKKPPSGKKPRWCRWCRFKLDPSKPAKAKWCSKECRDANRKVILTARNARKRPCPVKGCRRRGACPKHYPHGHRRRAEYWGVQYEPIVSELVYERDGWMCGLCSEPVDKSLRHPDLMSVSLDHIKPLSRGGDHLWDNVQCSHLICNMRKHNRESLETQRGEGASSKPAGDPATAAAAP